MAPIIGKQKKATSFCS